METYNIKKNEAVKILESFGYKTASDFSLEKLQEKINQLPSIMEEAKTQNEKIPENILKRVDVLLAYQSNQISIVVENEQSEKKGTDEMKKEKKKHKSEKEVKKSSKEKTEKKIASQKSEGTKKIKSSTKEKTPKEKSIKQTIYEKFLKVKPEDANSKAEKWFEEINKKVKLATIRSWIGQWKSGKGLPKGAEKKKSL
jgi:type II secretory ATPase GspE/PulE/Tfp pilus assembly ATPase PilB-like protein